MGIPCPSQRRPRSAQRPTEKWLTGARAPHADALPRGGCRSAASRSPCSAGTAGPTGNCCPAVGTHPGWLHGLWLPRGCLGESKHWRSPEIPHPPPRHQQRRAGTGRQRSRGRQSVQAGPSIQAGPAAGTECGRGAEHGRRRPGSSSQQPAFQEQGRWEIPLLRIARSVGRACGGNCEGM